MIEYIKGIITEKQITHIAIEAGDGVAYAVNISLSTYETLPALDKQAKVYIHYHVREDDVKLYGFATTQEREIFRHLITVNTIGPKVAMNILSSVSTDNLIAYVNAGNTAGLKKIPGVGPKMADRIIVELRDKLKMYSSNAPTSSQAKKIGANTGAKEEAYAAMLSLGYNDKQVSKAIDIVSQQLDGNAQIEEWVKKALQAV